MVKEMAFSKMVALIERAVGTGVWWEVEYRGVRRQDAVGVKFYTLDYDTYVAYWNRGKNIIELQLDNLDEE